jgi:hypothetical protein
VGAGGTGGSAAAGGTNGNGGDGGIGAGGRVCGNGNGGSGGSGGLGGTTGNSGHRGAGGGTITSGLTPAGRPRAAADGLHPDRGVAIDDDTLCVLAGKRISAAEQLGRPHATGQTGIAAIGTRPAGNPALGPRTLARRHDVWPQGFLILPRGGSLWNRCSRRGSAQGSLDRAPR